MSRRHFSMLLIVSIVVAAAILLLVPRESGVEEDRAGGPLLETIAPRINEADRVVISAGGGTPVTTLNRVENRWTIGELGDYPADWQKLRQVLADLARAKVLEIKTSNPEYYPRLGVEDVSASDAGGLLLEVAAGEQTESLIVGDSAGGPGGQFVRIADRPQSVLIDRNLELTAEPVEWADRSIVNIGSGLVAEVEIRHPDGDRILASKVSADDADFTLENLPEGRSLVSAWSVNSLASALASLRMNKVQAEPLELAADPVVFRLLTFQGVEVVAELFDLEGEKWARISAKPPAGEAGGEESSAQANDPHQQAREINDRTRGWIYALPESKTESLSQRLEQLLQPLQDPVETGSS